MARREPSRHVFRGVLGGLVLGLGLALVLILYRVSVVPPDVVIGLCLVLGLALGLAKLPRSRPAP